jgi:MFS family permease
MKSFRPFTSLTYRNFRLFWFGQVVSLTGSWMYSAGKGWLVLKLTNSPFYLGLVGSAATMPILLFALAGGVIADRFPKRNVLLVTHFLFMVFSFVLGVLVSIEKVVIWHVLVIAFLTGVVSAFDIPARQSFLIEMVGRKNLMNAIALNSAAFNGARVIGPTIAGFLMKYLGIGACFYGRSFSIIAAITGLLKMDTATIDTKKIEKTGIIKEFREGLGYIFKEPKIYTLIIIVGIISFFGFPYITFLPIYARDVLKIGAEGLGFLMGCAGAGALIGALNLAVRGDFPGKGLFLVVSGVIFSTSLFLFSQSQNVWLSYSLLVLIGWSAISQIATANSLIQLAVPDSLRGRIMSSFTMVFLGMATLGNFIVGSLAVYVGTTTALGMGAKFCLLGILWLLWKKKDILRL